ncbi:MAG: hypothetical protein DI534_01505 [Leifsonia xyli]|jgi:ArsR family transcriptional regulator|nr:MAG: hypothetical protein DI534_01505 [Leifsonia xyli]
MGSGERRSLQVLAEPTRARILELIRTSSAERMRVTDLASQLGLTQPTVSHHVKELAAEGLLLRAAEGRNVWYFVPEARVDAVDGMLGLSSIPLDEDPTGRIVDDLSLRFVGRFNRPTIEEVVRDSRSLLEARRASRRALTSQIARFASTRLEALERSDLEQHAGPPEVLFVCVQNAGRSQIAAAILRHLAGGAVRVRTAGSMPAGEIRAAIATVLDEIGVSLDGEFPKPLTDDAVQSADIVITMGCGDVCPVYPGRRYLDWDIADPVGLPIAEVREIRNDIDQRVRALLAELR